MVASAPPTTDRFADDERWSLISPDPYPLLIGGELRPAADGATFDAVSPRDERTVARIAAAGPADVDAAVLAARSALDGSWGGSTARERSRVLEKIADALQEHADEIAFLEAVDAGKPVGSVHYSDISISLDALRFFGGQAQALTARSAAMPDAGVTHLERLEPMGVVAEIFPWNGPLWTGIQRMAAILAAGNAALLKPASPASLAFARFAQLLAELEEIPAGAINVLSGSGSVVGDALVRHPGVDMISLTGGIETGTRVLELAAPQVKRVSLEMGGKNPNIVCDDADLDRAIFWSKLGAFGNTGQICVCGSRILVQRPIYDEFVERLAAAAQEMRVGDPLDTETELGPVISREHAEKVWDYVGIGKSESRLVTGGEAYTDPVRGRRTYIPPTVFADATPSCRTATEEIFGPVVSLLPFDTLEEALQIANDTTYGLASGLFTQDLDRAAYLSRGLKAGQVYVNQWFSPGVLEAPSHGYKQSGIGGVGMRKYMQSKNVFTRSVDPS